MDRVGLGQVLEPVDLAAENDIVLLGKPKIRQFHVDFYGQIQQGSRVLVETFEHIYPPLFVAIFGLAVKETATATSDLGPGIFKPWEKGFAEAVLGGEYGKRLDDFVDD